jgi:hypothetical protein
MVVRLEVVTEVMIVADEVEATIRGRDRTSVVVMDRVDMDVEGVDMGSKVEMGMVSRVATVMVNKVEMVMVSRVEMATAMEVDTRVVDMVVDAVAVGGEDTSGDEEEIRRQKLCCWSR